MPYNICMNENKRYPFSFTPLMLALFWAGLLLCLAGFALTVWRFAAFLMDGGLSPYGWAQYALLFFACLVLSVLLISMLVRSQYVIGEKHILLQLGVIRIKYPLKDLKHIHLFRGSRKLALYFEGEKPSYAAVVIKSSLFDEFVQELLSRCPSAEFSFSTPEEENEEKKKKK